MGHGLDSCQWPTVLCIGGIILTRNCTPRWKLFNADQDLRMEAQSNQHTRNIAMITLLVRAVVTSGPDRCLHHLIVSLISFGVRVFRQRQSNWKYGRQEHTKRHRYYIIFDVLDSVDQWRFKAKHHHTNGGRFGIWWFVQLQRHYWSGGKWNRPHGLGRSEIYWLVSWWTDVHAKQSCVADRY